MAVRVFICVSLPARSRSANTRTRKGSTNAIFPKSPLHMSCIVIPKLPVVSITTVKKRKRATAISVMLQITSLLRFSRSLLRFISSRTSCFVGFPEYEFLAADEAAGLEEDFVDEFLGLFLLPGGLPGPLLVLLLLVCCAIIISSFIYNVDSQSIILQHVDFITVFLTKQKPLHRGFG